MMIYVIQDPPNYSSTLCFIKKNIPLAFCYISAKCRSMTVKIGTNIHLLNVFKPE